VLQKKKKKEEDMKVGEGLFGKRKGTSRRGESGHKRVKKKKKWQWVGHKIKHKSTVEWAHMKDGQKDKV
jgi:hypothetical protein